jgi:hypothetical protein
MLVSTLIATSATIILVLGLTHLVLTFFTRALGPRDALLEERLKSVSPIITGHTTMWRSQVGFNASHSLGAILFGSVYGYLAIADREFLIASHFLVALGGLALLGYVVLAKLYWFSAPFALISLALACYVIGVVVAYA